MKGKSKKSKNFSSPTKKKILLLLQAGIILGITHSYKGRRWFFGQLAKEWDYIDRQYLYRAVREFYKNRLIDWQERSDGTIEAVLTESGKERVLEYNFDEMKIKKPHCWDNKWRVVFFDIPEKRRKARDALRKKLKELGFCEMQKSVFVYPYDCQDEIDFVTEFFEIRPFVRYAEMLKPTNEAQLKIYFDLK